MSNIDWSKLVTPEQREAAEAAALRRAQFPNLEPDQFWFVVRASGFEQTLTDWVAAMNDAQSPTYDPSVGRQLRPSCSSPSSSSETIHLSRKPAGHWDDLGRDGCALDLRRRVKMAGTNMPGQVRLAMRLASTQAAAS